LGGASIKSTSVASSCNFYFHQTKKSHWIWKSAKLFNCGINLTCCNFLYIVKYRSLELFVSVCVC
jgi:hypothetical protein